MRMDPRTLDPDVRGALSELEPLITSSPLLATVGGTVVDWGPGWAVVDVPTSAALTNIAGTVHGAVVTAAADCALEIASNSYGRMAVAVALNGQFTAAAEPGTTLRAVAHEVSLSRALASYRIEVTDGSTPETGRLLAWFQATAHRSREWRLGAARWPETWTATY
jgi:acyl-CoA thioesterase